MNVFDGLCDAIERRDPADVGRLLAEMVDLEHDIERVQQVISEVRAVVTALPEIWGGDAIGQDKAKEEGA